MAQRDSGYIRKDFDHYDTPEWVTRALAGHLLRDQLYVWEPAGGHAAIERALYDIGVREVIATDIQEENFHGGIGMTHFVKGGVDFLTAELPAKHINAIVTNPPYTAATEFIEHALELMKPVKGMVAMLLRTDFDHAKSRRHLFADHPAFAKKIVLTNRIQWFEPPPGAKGKSPSENHSWWIWDWSHRGWPVIVYEGKQ